MAIFKEVPHLYYIKWEIAARQSDYFHFLLDKYSAWDWAINWVIQLSLKLSRCLAYDL